MTKTVFNRYMELLETKVADGDMQLFEWYRKVGTSHANGKLTKAEFKKLLKVGKDYEY